MGAPRFALRAWLFPAAFGLVPACAADPGDPVKTLSDGEVPETSAGVETGVGTGGDDSTSPPTVIDASSGDDAAFVDVGADGTAMETGGDVGVADVHGDAACNLQNIPASCPNCTTMNASDMPACEKYLQCFANNGCNPNAPTPPCAQMDGVCGVNTIGGGTAPQQAAVMTYSCACP
jgi:hypothetical protein